MMIALLLVLPFVEALDNGLSKTPPMGTNTWNVFRDKISEEVIKTTADILVSSGLAEKGYKYVNMDDAWAGGRDSNGLLFPNATKFPSGIKALADYVHSKKLLFGIYTDAGHKTCQKLPGTWGHEETDAQTFADWTCDFVKTDSCFTNNDSSIQPADGPNCLKHYEIFAKALNATGRPMVHSVKGPCGRVDENGVCSPANASSIANLRRTSGDVNDNWASVERIVNDAAQVAALSSPGFFGDMDILEIGNGGLSQAEEETMFTMWCVLKSPLLLGNDLSKMNAETLRIVGNDLLITINQDALGTAARIVFTEGLDKRGWAGPLAGGDMVAVLQNTGNISQTMHMPWSALGLDTNASLEVTDLWGGGQAKTYQHYIPATVEAHGVAAFRLHPTATK
jgi:alpha-galactosidase